jgi:hypothetical protein
LSPTGRRAPDESRAGERFNAPLQVIRFIGTKKGDEERGPAVWMNRNEATTRLLDDGELVWVHGPRRHELAALTTHCRAAA